jgi:hypothetical protein
MYVQAIEDWMPTFSTEQRVRDTSYLCGAERDKSDDPP